MAKIPIRVVNADNTGRTRSHVTFEGDISDMYVELNCKYATISLVAPIRLDATRELLSRVQGHTPIDYYARFDQYRKYDNSSWVRHSHLEDRAELGPTCANEFGFTKALAYCNSFGKNAEDIERHYFAHQCYHLLMKPFSGFDCINRTVVKQANGMMGKRKLNGEMVVSFGYEGYDLSCFGFGGFDFREFDWPNGSIKGRGPLLEMPVVRYTFRRMQLHRDPRCRIAGEIKEKLQHAIKLHNSAEQLLSESRAPFGEYNAIGPNQNYLTVEEVA